MQLYETNNGDRIDLIVMNFYGNLNHLNDVLSRNLHLSKKSMSLKSGLKIELPNFEIIDSKQNVTVQVREPLW